MSTEYWNEKWIDLKLEDHLTTRFPTQISNYGRIKRFKKDKEFISTGGTTCGYSSICVTQKTAGNKKTARYIHKLVAQHFIPNPENKEFVIHLNYNKLDNRVHNLQWATRKEREEHQYKNPIKHTWKYTKLTPAKVKIIKQKLADPNRKTRLKMIAKQFGVSEMQLYRIKSGENWRDITID